MKNYTKVPNYIIDNENIDVTSKMILIYIYSKKDLKGWRFCYTSIAKSLKINKKTIQRHVKWLINNDFVEHFQQDGKWIFRLKFDKKSIGTKSTNGVGS